MFSTLLCTNKGMRAEIEDKRDSLASGQILIFCQLIARSKMELTIRNQLNLVVLYLPPSLDLFSKFGSVNSFFHNSSEGLTP